MTLKDIIIIGSGIIIEGLLLFVLLTKLKIKRDRPTKIRRKWVELQKYCAKKETWPKAVLEADKLLGDTLKKLKVKGKSTGERMVSAQKTFSDNDKVWFAHNLAKKLGEKKEVKLREADVKKALIGVRQALRDLEVLNDK